MAFLSFFGRDTATITKFVCSDAGLCTWSNPGPQNNPLLLTVSNGYTVQLSPTATKYQIPAGFFAAGNKITLTRFEPKNTFSTTVPKPVIGPPVNIDPPYIY